MTKATMQMAQDCLGRIKELESENLLLGERCNQLLKDKGDLTDQIADIKANCDYVLEGKEIEYREERKRLCDDFENMKATLESKIAQLEQQIEKMKNWCNCGNYLNCIIKSEEEDFKAGVCHNCTDWELKEKEK